MRFLLPAALLSASLAACATTDQPPERGAAATAELARWLDGRTPGKAQSCLPSYRTQNQIVIDDRTILYRDGSNRVWRNEMRGPCSGLDRPGNAMVIRHYGGGQLCSGEIVQIVDTASGFTTGSCSFGEFVPYNGPMRRS